MTARLGARSERCIAPARVLPRLQGWILGLLFLAGCTGQPEPAPGDDGFGPNPIGGDAGVACAHPARGCACSPEQPPIDCYLEPIVGEHGLTCRRGTRYCRDGAWTGCESIESYEFRSGPGIAPLSSGPTECNPCDPACAVSRDVPTDDDLPGRSTDVDYDPIGGGIVLEPSGDVSPPLSDSDGDGVPDIADECDGPGAILAPNGTCHTGMYFFHELPYGGPAEIDPLDIGVQVRTADVYFLMDTTGSMDGEIANLRSGLTTGTYIPGCSGGIIGAIRCTIPDAWFGVGQHDDYPVAPYGRDVDIVYSNLLDITSSVSAAQAAVNALSLHRGNDDPESQTQALWAIATGGGLGPYLSPRTDCPAGTWGYPCFRDGTIPIIVLFTDAPFHNGPSGHEYDLGTPLPPPTAVSGNDDIASAYDVGDVGTSWLGFTGNTCGYDDDFNAGCASDSAGDVVFRFTLAERRTITVTTEGSTLDTVLSILNASRSEIACDDNSGPGSTSELTVTLNPGTYYAVVTGYRSNCGAYRLTLGNPSSFDAGYPVTWSQTVSALDSRGIRVITIHSGGTGSSSGISDARALADATGSVSSSGSRYVFSISSNGSGLSSTVVDAIVDLANYHRMDISARAVDNPETGAVDERDFVSAITAVGWGPGSCSGISGGHTFVQCLPGTRVDFRIAFQNDVVMPSTEPQVFTFWIEVVGDGAFVLERVPVRIVVPPIVPMYPPSGSYFRDYDTTLFCLDTERPDWNTLAWEAVSIPEGTSIRWELRAATTAAELASASPVTVTTPPEESPIDIGATLMGAGVPNYLPHLRVTAVLRSNDARSATPTLRSFEVRYTCIPHE